MLAESLHAQRLGPLATTPDWRELEQFQETITRAGFVQLLNEVYAPGAAAAGVIEVRAVDAVVRTKLSPVET